MVARICRHLWAELTLFNRARDPALTQAIEAEISAAERTHEGEIVFAIETSLPLAQLWRRQSPRARAEQVFAGLRVWDTAANNGVIIYLLLAEQALEIVTDRGVTAKVSSGAWEQLCRSVATQLAAGQFVDGARQAVRGVAAQLQRHWPAVDRKGNELPNQPVLL